MPLTKNTAPASREKRPDPISFRFTKESVVQLKVLSELFNRKQTEILAVLLADEYSKAKAEHGRELKKIEAKIREELGDD